MKQSPLDMPLFAFWTFPRALQSFSVFKQISANKALIGLNNQRFAPAGKGTLDMR
jgi:hypothetical protein